MAKNVYGELFDQLPIPERLSPENIAKMLDEHMEANGNRRNIAVSESSVNRSTPKRTTHSAAYRAIMSVAACAVLVLGLIRFTADDNPAIKVNEPAPGSYAEDYDQLHKTFQKYYVDEDNKTLDSAIAEIEHSYNEAENNTQTDEVKEPEVTTTDSQVTEEVQPPVTEDTIPSTETPDIDEVPDVEEEEIVDETHDEPILLPDIDGFDTDHGIIVNGGRIFVKDCDSLRVFNTDGGFYNEAFIQLIMSEGENKSLKDVYVIGDRVALVYGVETTEAVTPVQTDEASEGSVLDELLGENVEEVDTVTRYSAEVRLYQLTSAGVYEIYSQSQAGSYVDSVEKDGSVYLITDYSDYRLSPIVGVNDLDSYVPTYTVMGEKRYIEASSILIPSKITTTDYTVISGLNTADLSGSVRALLGFEGRVVATGEAVYIFGLGSDTTGTYVEKFSLNGGIVDHNGFTVIDGLALSGDGISLCADAILISTVNGTDTGCTTTVRAYNTSLEVLSKVDFPGFFANVHKDGSKLYYGNETMAYGVDFEDPAHPVLVEATSVKDVTDYLVEFEDGYLTLTEQDGSLVLTKVIENADGELVGYAETVVYSGSFTSKALENNDLMFRSGSLVGVPYGYYDGLDYCYTYALYKSTATGFELVGSFETHETDTAFELGRGIDVNGSLYLFSEGRIYQLTATESTLALNSRVDLIYSTYSGHNNW